MFRNSAINLVGLLVPLLAAVFAVPQLIAILGMQRFGLLTLSWAVIGYMSLFDLGLGPALVQRFAKFAGSGEQRRLTELVHVAAVVFGSLAIVGGAATYIAAPVLAHVFAGPRGDLYLESLACFQVLSLAVPMVILSAGLNAVLEARHRFDLANAVSVPLGVLNFVAPLLVLQVVDDVPSALIALTLGRLIAVVALTVLAVKVAGVEWRNCDVSFAEMRELMRFGGWVTVSRVVVPALTFVDRILIGAVSSLAALAHYSVAVEVANRVLLFPMAVTRVLLPTMSQSVGATDARLGSLLRIGLALIAITTYPVALLLTLGAQEGLTLWLGPEFGGEAHRALQILVIGAFISSHAYPAVSLLQSLGRPDYTAKIQIVQVPIYFVFLWLAIQHFGIVGAATASTIRIILDVAMHLFLSARLLAGLEYSTMRLLAISLAGAASMVGAMYFAGSEPLFFALAASAHATTTWFAFIKPDERRILMGRFLPVCKRPKPPPATP